MTLRDVNEQTPGDLADEYQSADCQSLFRRAGVGAAYRLRFQPLALSEWEGPDARILEKMQAMLAESGQSVVAATETASPAAEVGPLCGSVGVWVCGWLCGSVGVGVWRALWGCGGVGGWWGVWVWWGLGG